MMPGLGAGLFILIRWMLCAIAIGLISTCVLYFLFQRIRHRSNAGKAEVESAGRPVTESFINRRRKTMLLIAVLIIGAQYFLAARDRMRASACEQEKAEIINILVRSASFHTRMERYLDFMMQIQRQFWRRRSITIWRQKCSLIAIESITAWMPLGKTHMSCCRHPR